MNAITNVAGSKKINVNPCGMKRNCKNVLGGHICSFPRRILTDKGLGELRTLFYQ